MKTILSRLLIFLTTCLGFTSVTAQEILFPLHSNSVLTERAMHPDAGMSLRISTVGRAAW